MKLRTQLILAFLLLAVLPLAGIVSYSYVTSLRAVQRTVEQEAQELTADMNRRMDDVERELRRRVESLSQLPLHRLLGGESGNEHDEVTRRLLSQLGGAASLVESFEFMPIAAPPPLAESAAPEAPAPPGAGATAADVEIAREMETIVFWVTQDVRERLGDLPDLEAHPMEGIRYGIEVAAALADAFGERFAEPGAAPLAPGAGRGVEIEQEIARREAGVEKEEARRALEEARQERQQARAQRQEKPAAGWLFRQGLELPVRVEGQLVGQVTTRIRAEQLLRQVLAHTRREQGEVPYAMGADGELLVAEEADRELLAGLALEQPGVSDDWVVATSEVPGTELRIGIARPMREPLAEVRRTAARNFGYGLGLIGLALVGILPLSRRMTRDLGAVTEGAERIAGGALETRVPVRSRDEVGQLASAFNDMARDLERNQEKLVQQELLQAEYARKTRELEEARQFQLSLLPKAVPRHPSFEIAVHMQTANEVGGDYYDFHLEDDGTLTTAVGDATGHGVRAGTMVTVVKSLFSAHASGSPAGGLESFLSAANRTIRRMDLGRMAMTLTLARLRRDALTVAAAGMPPVLLHRAASGSLEEVELQGMPLGSLESAYRERHVALQAGDTVLLMTDGFPELLDRDGEVLGYGRAREAFAAAAAKAPQEIVDDLAAAVASWTDGERPNDDVTFVVIRVR